MLSATELSGFGVMNTSMTYTYLGRYTSSPSTYSANFSVTIPAGTQSLVIGHTTLSNGYGLRTITSITVGGLSATYIRGVTRVTEYTNHAGFWVVNVASLSGQTVTMTVTHDLISGHGGAWTDVYALNKAFLSYGYDSSGIAGAGDPLTASVSVYEGGFAAAVWSSYPGVCSINYFPTTHYAGGTSVQRACAEVMPTVSATPTIYAEDGSGNYNQAMCVVSFARGRFSY